MTLNWFKNFPSLAKRELLDTETSINTRNLLDEGSKNLAQLIILFLLSILILLNQKKLVMWINESNKLAAKPKTDTYMSVIKASFWTAVKSLNWPMWSLIIGYILSYMHPKIGIYDIGQIIKVNNIRLAIIIWIWAFSYHFYKENSINKIHFKREFNKNIQWYHMGFLGLLASYRCYRSGDIYSYTSVHRTYSHQSDSSDIPKQNESDKQMLISLLSVYSSDTHQ